MRGAVEEEAEPRNLHISYRRQWKKKNTPGSREAPLSRPVFRSGPNLVHALLLQEEMRRVERERIKPFVSFIP